MDRPASAANTESIMATTTTPAEQRWNPDDYAQNARFVSDLAGPVLDLLAPKSGERILDLGCGDGVLTARLATLGCDVLGVDSSPEQVAAARKRGVHAECRDGAALDFDRAFDAVFSNAALHWMRDPDAVIAGVHRALVPGGRFVGEFGGHGGLDRIRAALRPALAARGFDEGALCPWYFPTAADYRARLESGGFAVIAVDLIPRPTPLPGDITAWLETFAQVYLAALPPESRPAFLTEVRDRLQPVLQNPDGRWIADYVRLRFAARRA
jgi:trans-aconitate methyltransferase